MEAFLAVNSPLNSLGLAYARFFADSHTRLWLHALFFLLYRSSLRSMRRNKGGGRKHRFDPYRVSCWSVEAEIHPVIL